MKDEGSCTERLFHVNCPVCTKQICMCSDAMILQKCNRCKNSFLIVVEDGTLYIELREYSA